MTTKDEALKLALEALKHCVDAITERGLNGNPEFAEKWGLKLPVDRASEAITAIKQALAAPVQEPVKPRCKVGGMPAPGHMCPMIIVGSKLCGEKGFCPHQEDTTPPAAQPAKEKAPQSANCEAPGRISSDHARDTNYKADQPVAVVSGYYGGQCVVLPTDPARLFNSGTAFYTTPPAAQRQWVDMPELGLLGAYEEEQQGRFGDHVRGLLNVQAKLKEKNT